MYKDRDDEARVAYLALAESWSAIREFVENAIGDAALRSQAEHCLIRVIDAVSAQGPSHLDNSQVRNLLTLQGFAVLYDSPLRLPSDAVHALETIRGMYANEELRHRTLGRIALTGLIKIQILSDEEPQGDSGSPEGGGSPEVRG
jgi:hypothetical protein